MNKTQKIIIGVILGVGVGVGAFLYFKNRKKKNTNKKPTGSSGDKSKSVDLSKSLSRSEKEEFILDNISASKEETTSGFEGAKFVWNPTIEKMYPVGTISVGEEPAYADAVFLSAEGDVLADIPQAVSNAEKSLSDLSEQEIDLIYQVTKKMKEDSSIKNEDEAISKVGVNNENILKLFRDKLKKRLNDVKIMKKDSSWSEKWNKRKEARKKNRTEFKQTMGFSKDTFNKVARQKCGRKPLRKSNFAQYKKCVETVADGMRKRIKNDVRSEIEKAPVSVKQEITQERQKQFQKELTNRSSGGIFAGDRWDGKSNEKVESLVDAGLV